jgi:hypothetical protein
MRQLPKQLNINIIGTTIFIDGLGFRMSYTPGIDIVKEEFRTPGCWFGGLQHSYPEQSSEAVQLEKDLVELCEQLLITLKRDKGESKINKK